MFLSGVFLLYCRIKPGSRFKLLVDYHNGWSDLQSLSKACGVSLYFIVARCQRVDPDYQVGRLEDDVESVSKSCSVLFSTLSSCNANEWI